MRPTAIVVALACLLGAAAAQADTLRVGKPEAKGFDFAILDVGVARGFFKQRNLDIDVLNFAGEAKQSTALAAGAIDMELGAGAALANIAKGLPAKGVAAMAGPPLNMCLLVLPGGPATPEALKGAAIGISTVSSLTDAMATLFSLNMGWGVDGFRRVPLGSMDSEVAGLLTHNATAIVGNTEQGYTLQETGRLKVLLLFGHFIKDYLTHAIYASDTLIAKNPDAIRHFLAAWFQTVKWMQANRTQSIALSRQVTLLPQDIAERIYDEQMKAMYFTDGHFPPKVMETMRRSFLQLHLLQQVPPNAALINESFLPPD